MIDWTKVIITADDDTVSEASGQVILLASGVPGESASVEVVETVTLDPLEDADVENVGDSRNVKLKFKIPRGQSGVWGGIGGTLEDQADLKQALNAKADIIHTSASGSLVHITDGAAYPVDSLSVAIDPVQDLHGYDAPWPAGGGKNLFDEVYTGIISGTTVTKRAIYVGDGTFTMSTTCPKGGSAANLFFASGSDTSVSVSTERNGVWVGNPRTFSSTDGYVIVGYRNNAGANPEDYLTQIESGSSATTYEPYSNICPISGHASATVWRSGKNLFTTEDGTFTSKQVQYTVSNGVITANGTATDTSFRGTTDIRLPAGTYRITDFGDASVGYINVQNATDPNNWPMIANTNNANKSGTFTLTEFTKIAVRVRIASGTTAEDAVYKPMLTVGTSIPDSFESGNIQTVTIDLDGTIYGGEYDVTTGVLTVDKVTLKVDGDDVTSYNVASSSRPPYVILSYVVPADAKNNHYKTNVSGICTQYIPSGQNGNPEFTCFRCTSERTIRVYDTRFTSEAVAKSLLSAETPTICYYLLDPQTVTLDPATLSLLKGENNVWADTGDTAVGYRADTKLYIDSKLSAAIAELQALILEH